MAYKEKGPMGMGHGGPALAIVLAGEKMGKDSGDGELNEYAEMYDHCMKGMWDAYKADDLEAFKAHFKDAHDILHAMDATDTMGDNDDY